MKNIKSQLFRRPLIQILFLLLSFETLAQVPQVPKEMQFADLTIRINEQARREIQLDVDALHRNQIYFKSKADRANLYLPLVERELRESGVPDDFKYLVIQESSLIPDAVSSSNAVGFWQFKQGTAEEVFLRVDNQIDERKNIVSSTRGAALYLKKNNTQFDNWMCALVSYQMGLGGAKAYFGSQFNGKKVVDVDRNSHWYFKKFLAHKIAFENHAGANFVSNTGYLEEVRIQGPSSLQDLSSRLGISEDHLREYNKWIGRGDIPSDKTYSVVYLKQGTPPARPIVAQRESSSTGQQQTQTPTSGFPRISGNQQSATAPNQIKVNNIEGVRAANSVSQASFAKQVGMKPNKFRKLNDLDKNDPVVAGQYYYLDKKATKADVANHVVMPGETLWSISQKYGIRLAALKAKNRIRDDIDLSPGMILNLQEPRKRGEDFVMVSGSEYRKMLEALSANQTQTNQATATSQTSTPASQPSTTVTPSTAPVTRTPEPVRTEPSRTEPARTEPVRTETTAPVRTPEPTRSTETVNRTQPSSTSSSSRTVHTVSPGETLFRISQNYGVSVDDLKRWNNLPDNTIKVGQEIIINPSGTSTQSRATTPSSTSSSGTIVHTVSPGETLFRLSQNYGVSVDDIRKWNNLPDNTIQVGQKITIIKP
ncbi:LysM peptidoglycan-binding domain-containing protein [Cecembia rubra]|uniref:Membrane-bound lytic murein transglycosylase D n=1 Tax=Cecembia rubra TaxID=1485585 RepID=A0A2P8E360_9BACT|nr:LysM peptidoglycan-binding domain-containing protein [Cecembia rubra]PSL03894.1 membrane-bound lytic murein transglycosylase D [Cecembia rubra]